MQHFLPSQRRRRLGATAVEFAVVAPIFFMLFLAIVEFSRAFMVTQLMTDAARRGCRQGIIEGATNSQITSAATSYLQACGISGENIQIVVNDAAGNTVEVQNVPAYTEITVQASVPMSSVTWLPVAGMQIYYPLLNYPHNPGGGYIAVGPAATRSLSGQFTMRRE